MFKSKVQNLFFICTVIIVHYLTSCNNSPENNYGVSVIQNDSIIEIWNKNVKGRFDLNKGIISQSFYVANENDWELMVKSFDRPDNMGQDVSPLYDKGADFANDYRLMAHEGLMSATILASTKDKVRILLSGEIGDNKIEQTVSLESNQNFFHIEVNGLLPKDRPKVEYLLSSFVFIPEGIPDYTFTPALKRSEEDVVGDRKFFAPATIVENNGLMAALVPDLYLINDNTVYAKGARPQKHPKRLAIPIDSTKISLPTAMDLSLNSGITDKPVISFGYMDYWVEQHVYWRHENKNGVQARELSDNNLKYGFDLFLEANVEKYRGYQYISSYLWKKYGSKYFHFPKPQAMPFSEYAKVCYPASFSYQGYDITTFGPEIDIIHRSGKPELATWQQWDEKGLPVGGLRLSAPQWYSFIYNTAWWNNVCDATGMYYWGVKQKDSTLVDKARRIINFTLSAPQKDGLFPGLYDLENGSWLNSLWNPSMENYDPNKAEAYWSFDNNAGAYQTASASVTAGYLMYYRQFCENNPDILPYVQKYGDFLIQNIDPNGCVPGWFNESLEPLPSLRFNADGGAHIWVLSELNKATGDKKYADAAKKIAEFMLKEVMPNQKWYDFETFYSCAIKPETFYDPNTGQYPANNMSLSWALEGFASLYEITKNDKYLLAAEATADYSIFYQAIWAPNYIKTAYPFGGVSSQNTDAEWLDQRSHRFAGGLVRIGLLSDRQDLLERGVAAARASLTLVNHPLLIQNDIYKYPNFPLGIGPENIDHEGFSQMPLRSGPSWGEVGGLAGASHIMRQLGSIYINFEKNVGLGIDGISVEDFKVKDGNINITMKSLLSELTVPYEESFTLEMRIEGLPDKNYELSINGGKSVSTTVNNLMHLKVLVKSGGIFQAKI